MKPSFYLIINREIAGFQDFIKERIHFLMFGKLIEENTPPVFFIKHFMGSGDRRLVSSSFSKPLLWLTNSNPAVI